MLKAILYFFAILFLLRLVFRLLFPGRIQSTFTYYRTPQPRQQEQSSSYDPEGTIKIHPRGRNKSEEGEFADYEEVK